MARSKKSIEVEQALLQWVRDTGIIPGESMSVKASAQAMNRAGLRRAHGTEWDQQSLSRWLKEAKNRGVILEADTSDTPPEVQEEPVTPVQDTRETPENHIVTPLVTPLVTPVQDSCETPEHTWSKSSVTQPEPPCVTPIPMAGLSPDEVDILHQVLEWWKERRGGSHFALLPETRPIFKRGSPGTGTKTVTIRLNANMLEAVKFRAESDKKMTGGTFNGLVELLLWQYLDEDPQYIDE